MDKVSLGLFLLSHFFFGMTMQGLTHDAKGEVDRLKWQENVGNLAGVLLPELLVFLSAFVIITVGPMGQQCKQVKCITIASQL